MSQFHITDELVFLGQGIENYEKVWAKEIEKYVPFHIY